MMCIIESLAIWSGRITAVLLAVATSIVIAVGTEWNGDIHFL